MCLFLRYVITFDKKERKLYLIDYIYHNVIETKVSCLHQKVAVAHFSYVQIFFHSQQLTRNQLWYMQDRATCHTTANNLQFLTDKFAERLISLKTEVVWPANSPDCNPLDFFFCGYVMQHVYRTQPSTID